MFTHGKREEDTLRPDFNRSIKVNFLDAALSSNTIFPLLGEVDERFSAIEAIGDALEDNRSPTHTKHSIVQMFRQRVYQRSLGKDNLLPYFSLLSSFSSPFPTLVSIALVPSAKAQYLKSGTPRYAGPHPSNARPKFEG